MGCFYSAIEKDEIMSFEGKWPQPEVIMVTEGSQTHKVKYCIFFLLCVSWIICGFMKSFLHICQSRHGLSRETKGTRRAGRE